MWLMIISGRCDLNRQKKNFHIEKKEKKMKQEEGFQTTGLFCQLERIIEVIYAGWLASGNKSHWRRKQPGFQ